MQSCGTCRPKLILKLRGRLLATFKVNAKLFKRLWKTLYGKDWLPTHALKLITQALHIRPNENFNVRPNELYFKPNKTFALGIKRQPQSSPTNATLWSQCSTKKELWASSAAIAADCLQKDNLNILENKSASNIFAHLTRVHVWNINILNMKYEPYKRKSTQHVLTQWIAWTQHIHFFTQEAAVVSMHINI